MTTTIGSLDLTSANSLYNDATQYFWFESDSTASYGAGVHITLSPSATFMSNPTGQNILINTDGISIRNGLLPMMTLDNDSLDFNVIDTEGGTFTNVASFGTTVSLGMQDTGNILIGADGIMINSAEAQLASLTGSGITFNTVEGTSALRILTSGDIIQKEITTNVSRRWSVYPRISSGSTTSSSVSLARGQTFDFSAYDYIILKISLPFCGQDDNDFGDTDYKTIRVNKGGSAVSVGSRAVSTTTYGTVTSVLSVKFETNGSVIATFITTNNYTSQQFYDRIYTRILAWTTLESVEAPLIQSEGVVDTEELRISDDKVVDYIIETGSSSPWKWAKYASGRIECWGEKSWSNVACTTSAGGGYRSGDQSQSLPSGLFTAIDSCQATMKGSGGSGYTMALRTLCTPTAISQMFWNTTNATKSTCTVDYYIIGT